MLKIKHLLIAFVVIIFLSCQSNKNDYKTPAQITYTDTITSENLTSFEHYIIREKGTERAFTGKYWDFFEDGIYVCKACNQILFNSDQKFNSNCGWPSFDSAIKGSVKYIEDKSLNMDRIEVTCSRCDAHLGHVFDDGPSETTGKRYCTNSASIKFISKNELSNTKN